MKNLKEVRAATDIVAKLLATENLKIIDGGTKVSYIDIAKREIHVVKFKNNSELNLPEVRLTSLAHEVGHALFTPIDLLHQKIDENYPNLAPFINIVEDVRIERLIKNRYAGLHRIMNKGRKIMYDNGVFGEDAINNPNGLEYINKFILAFKVGKNNTNGLVLTTFEDCILRYIEIHAINKESVIKCAKILYNLCEFNKLPEDVMKQIMESLKNNNVENSDSESDSDNSMKITVNGDEDNLEENSKSGKSDEEKEDNETDGNDSSSSDEKNDDNNEQDSSDESSSEQNSDDNSEESEDDGIDPNKLLSLLKKLSDEQNDDDIKFNKEYNENILEKLDKNLENHVDYKSITATISKTFFSNNLIKEYVR